MDDAALSRRGFLKAAGSAAGVGWVAAVWPAVLAAAEQAAAARDAKAAFEVLTVEDAADLAAIAAQIFPSDGTPGANEAGVVYFMDSALRTFMADAADAVAAGLKALNQKAGARRFAGLAPAEQTKLLKAEENSPVLGPFLGRVHFMTIAGMFSLPVYGGNRDYAGWKLLGFQHQHAWLPPFGYYDAQAGGKK